MLFSELASELSVTERSHNSDLTSHKSKAHPEADMTKMLLPALALLMMLTPAVNSVAQTPAAAGAKSCAADFDALEAKVRGDYAGFQDKVTAQGREAELDAFTERVRREV